MNGIHARSARHTHDVSHVEIGLDRGAAGPHEIALVGGEAMEGGAIRLRKDGDGADVELLRGAHDADGDLAAVGDQQPADPIVHRGRYASATSILRPSAPMTMAKIRLSERSDVRWASRAPMGASTMLPTVNPIKAGT